MRAVAFVRNVMVGRQGLTRDVLLDVFRTAGAGEPRSHLATGNVVFAADDPLDPGLREAVERGLAAVLGRHEPVFVRPLDRLAELVDRDPFAAAPWTDVRERCVSFADAPFTLALPLAPDRGDVVVFATDTAEAFSVTRLVGGRPGTAGPLLERATGRRVTTRNWSTVLRVLRPAS